MSLFTSSPDNTIIISLIPNPSISLMYYTAWIIHCPIF